MSDLRKTLVLLCPECHGQYYDNTTKGTKCLMIWLGDKICADEHIQWEKLAIYTIRTWCMTVLENVHLLIGQSAKPEFLHLLVGQSAKPEFLQKLTYLCWNHHKAVRHIDTVRAYTFGSQYFVDVDIVLLCDMPLQEAHNIGEALQEKLESWSRIERSFVHLDYEFTHQPEHVWPYGT